MSPPRGACGVDANGVDAWYAKKIAKKRNEPKPLWLFSDWRVREAA